MHNTVELGQCGWIAEDNPAELAAVDLPVWQKQTLAPSGDNVFPCGGVRKIALMADLVRIHQHGAEFLEHPGDRRLARTDAAGEADNPHLWGDRGLLI